MGGCGGRRSREGISKRGYNEKNLTSTIKILVER
jgi:hypothetical protein